MISQVTPLGIEQWHASLGQDKPLLVLDVREPHEVAFAHVTVPGVEVLTIPMGTVPVRLQELDDERPIACLCHHGGRSMQVASFLASRGYAHVANISGGIDAWSQQRDTSIPRY